MSDLSHERDRLIALVDQWIADREDEDADDARIEQAAIVGLIVATDADGEDVEGVLVRWETSRAYAQLGIANAMVREAERPFFESLGDA